MDLREHPPVRPLTPEYLAEAAAQQQQNTDAKPKPVILAPFGLSAVLTGQSYRALDPQSQKALEDWFAFYPLCNRENSELPPIVEVISGGVKMRYPSKYVLVTDVDDPDFSLEKFSESCNPMQSSSEISAGNDLGNPLSLHQSQTTATLLPERVWQDCIIGSSHHQNAIMSAGNTTTTGGTSQPNDDTSTSSSSSSSSSSTSNASPSDNQQTTSSPSTTQTSTIQNNNNFWDFQDPTQKTTCTCAK